uniref:Uncharacterized protein n=1 Tax=Arundo donax TaxID=35708 RepID=A0A0A8ZPK6_ARUDO
MYKKILLCLRSFNSACS